MTNKELFNEFITKYYLNNNIEAAVVKYKPNEEESKSKVRTICTNASNNIVADIYMQGLNLGDEALEFGVYNTKQLLRSLNIISDLKGVKFTKEENRFITLKMTDGRANSEFILSDPSIINVPKLNSDELPEPEIIIQIDSEFREFYGRIKSALSDEQYFTICKQKDKLRLAMGQSQGSKSHNASFLLNDLTEEDYNHTDIHFDSNAMAEILANNKGDAVFKISLKGVGILEFKTKNSKATYYLLKKDIK